MSGQRDFRYDCLVNDRAGIRPLNEDLALPWVPTQNDDLVFRWRSDTSLNWFHPISRESAVTHPTHGSRNGAVIAEPDAGGFKVNHFVIAVNAEDSRIPCN
jgi:hypothetical protein